MPEWGSSEFLFVTARTSAICSLLGSGGCIFLFFYFKWWKVSNHHIILFHMSCADILYSALVVVGKASYDIPALCDFQGFILQSCGQVSQMWCTVIGVNLLVQMVLYWPDKRCREMMRWYICVIYATGITTGSVVTFRGLMRPLGTWCWVGGDWPLERMVFFYVPLWLLFTSNVIIVSWIIRAFGKAVKRIPQGFDNRAQLVKHYRWVVFHTSMFVVVGMVVWLPGTIFRIWQIWDLSPPYWLSFAQVALTPCQGLLNFLLYVTPMWSKSVAENRKQDLLSNQMQMAEIQKDEKVAKTVQARTAPAPVKTKRVAFPDDYSSDDDVTSNKTGQKVDADNFELPRGQSMPHSFNYNRGKDSINKTSSNDSLNRAKTDHQIEIPEEEEEKDRRISRLRKSFLFHSNLLVSVDEKGIPLWEAKTGPS